MFSAITGFFQSNILIIGGILLVSFLGYFGYSQWRISSLEKETLANEITIETQKNNLEQLRKDAEQIKNINRSLTETEQRANQNENTIRQSLDNIGTVAKNNPEVVEDKINNATVLRLRCFELATGSRPERNEKNAICPHLIQ